MAPFFLKFEHYINYATSYLQYVKLEILFLKEVYNTFKSAYYWRQIRKMWVITLYDEENIKMFEFDNEEEAKQSLKKMKGRTILSHVVYFNDSVLEAVHS